MLNVAPQLGQNAQDTSNLVGRISSGYYSNPLNDPNFQGAAQAALAPSCQSLTEQILPNVTDASLRAGGSGTGPSAYGGTGGGSPQDVMTPAGTEELVSDSKQHRRFYGGERIQHRPWTVLADSWTGDEWNFSGPCTVSCY